MTVPPRVFVFLGRGRSAETWSRLHAEGKVFEPFPYGYSHASPHCELAYSVDRREDRFSMLLRRGVGRVLGFDLLHAVRNLRGLRSADVVWTHTEREHLAVAALTRLRLVRAPTIAQSVWLWDQWAGRSVLRRRFLRWLLRSLALHTTLSPENAAVGTAVLGCRVVVIPYGVEPSLFSGVAPSAFRDGAEIRVLAPGNDRHRDWRVLADAAGREPSLAVRIASGNRAAREVVATAPGNVVVARPDGVADLLARYTWADVVAVPLVQNLHASGITVALEALASSRPVAMTRTGGVDWYFGDSVSYAEVGDAGSLLEAIRAAAAVADEPAVLAERARRVSDRGLTLKDFALRHVLLTQYLLGSRGPEAVDAASALAPIEL